ncbi:MAG: hypothetical protein ABL951_15800, partial [Alphaproteobacteria bacterium]
MNEVNVPQAHGLTRTQYFTLCIIQELIAANGIAPSLDEIARELGIVLEQLQQGQRRNDHQHRVGEGDHA